MKINNPTLLTFTLLLMGLLCLIILWLLLGKSQNIKHSNKQNETQQLSGKHLNFYDDLVSGGLNYEFNELKITPVNYQLILATLPTIEQAQAEKQRLNQSVKSITIVKHKTKWRLVSTIIESNKEKNELIKKLRKLKISPLIIKIPKVEE